MSNEEVNLSKQHEPIQLQETKNARSAEEILPSYHQN